MLVKKIAVLQTLCAAAGHISTYASATRNEAELSLRISVVKNFPPEHLVVLVLDVYGSSTAAQAKLRLETLGGAFVERMLFGIGVVWPGVEIHGI